MPRITFSTIVNFRAAAIRAMKVPEKTSAEAMNMTVPITLI